MKIKAFSFERDSFTLSDVKKSVIDTLDGAGLYFESFSNANSFFEYAAGDDDTTVTTIESRYGKALGLSSTASSALATVRFTNLDLSTSESVGTLHS